MRDAANTAIDSLLEGDCGRAGCKDTSGWGGDGRGGRESFEVLAEQRLGRQGFHVKLDRGFEDGTYCVYVEFDDSRHGWGSPCPPAGRQILLS